MHRCMAGWYIYRCSAVFQRVKAAYRLASRSYHLLVDSNFDSVGEFNFEHGIIPSSDFALNESLDNLSDCLSALHHPRYEDYANRFPCLMS